MSTIPSSSPVDPPPVNSQPWTGQVSGGPSASSSSSFGYPQVENIWIQAGGNPQAAAMAAAVADASSGFDPSITRTNPDGSVSVGLWLIPQNGQPPGSTDPLANARAAIQMSSNGSDWSQWCVAWSDNDCGCDGGTYLGSGANALGSLAQRLTPASYNVIGSAPAGDGTGASSATAGATGTPSSTTSSSASKFVLIAAVVGVLILVVWIARRGQAKVPDSVDNVLPGTT